ncbi:MAG: ribosomal-processing cysteine protease Prp [Eubacteriales bacterium]|nr:ribosomal-processing cysteine protease Prp [Eubacteriales bacterium]MDY5439682.1 ribosomal-processing cysteine protease Prp [Eubacteriales bacterium]
MTIVRVKRVDNKIVSVECDGHTGYGEEGEDIVCAALSSIVQTAILGLLQVAKINIKYEIFDGSAHLKFTLPKDMTSNERHDADIILETMFLGVVDLNQGYSDFVELEVI